MTGEKITVLGIGNLLLKDEGVGIHVIESLKKEQLPDNVELVDGAVAGFDLLPVVEGCDKLIVIDAIKTNEPAGAIFRFDPQEIDIHRESGVSLHEVDFFQVLDVSKKRRKLPKIVMIAIVPEQLGWGMELSACLAGKLDKLKSLVKEEISKDF